MIRLLVLDVDGTMTDGGVYYDATGNELKKFAIKDGAGLVLARTAGIRVMICTGRECEAVRRRAADLKITDIYQNVGKKAAFLRDFMAENGYARGRCRLLRRRPERSGGYGAVRLCGLPGGCRAGGAGARRLYLPPARRRGCRPRSCGEDPARGRTLERRCEKGVSGGIVTLNLRAAVGVDACIDPRADASIRPYGLTEGDFMKNKKHTPLLAALATLVVLLAGRGADLAGEGPARCGQGPQ